MGTGETTDGKLADLMINYNSLLQLGQTTLGLAMRILLIDGNQNELAVNRDFLESMGHKVVEVNSAEKALTTFQSGDFDLVMTELNLPGSIGLALIESFGILKPNIPVVVLTEGVSLNKAIQAVKLNAVDVVLKPVDEKSIEGMLKEIPHQTKKAVSSRDHGNDLWNEVMDLKTTLEETQLQFEKVRNRLDVLEQKAQRL